jgi:hypothetical protein
VPEKNKNTALTMISAHDSCTLLLACSLMKFYKPDIKLAFYLHFTLGLVAFVLFYFCIPESPKWLFLKKGSSNKKAISVLNYIAWFNGSDMRVPDNA